ncbi:hypothetical protein Tco_1236722 [Tanacetum coccineum]
MFKQTRPMQSGNKRQTSDTSLYIRPTVWKAMGENYFAEYYSGLSMETHRKETHLGKRDCGSHETHMKETLLEGNSQYKSALCLQCDLKSILTWRTWTQPKILVYGKSVDFDLKWPSRKHTCLIRDIKGTDILKGSTGNTIVHNIMIDEMDEVDSDMLSDP